MNAGIYRIRNRENSECYYGSSTNCRKRRIDHFSKLKRRVHSNSLLQSAWTEYGKDAFVFEVIVILETDELLPTEDRILHLGAYNIVKSAVPSTLGLKLSPETRRRMSKAKKGIRHSKERRLKMSISAKEYWKNNTRIVSKETRQRMSQAQLNRTDRPFQKPRTASFETSKKLSEASKKIWGGAGFRQRMSEVHKQAWAVRKERANEALRSKGLPAYG